MPAPRSRMAFLPSRRFPRHCNQIPAELLPRKRCAKFTEPPRGNFSPLHHVIGLPSFVITTEEPPPPRTASTTLSTSRHAPRQFFPTVSGSKPSRRAMALLTCLRLSAQSVSIAPHANLPFQFIVGCLALLN